MPQSFTLGTRLVLGKLLQNLCMQEVLRKP